MSPKDQQDSSSSDFQHSRQSSLSTTDEDLGNAQHLIVIRHGDRWDYENRKAWKKHPHSRKGDPPLSSLGHEQAREVGRYLNGFFKQYDMTANDITWMSSPFLRTLQTSNEALSQLTIEGANHIPILPEDGVFEWDGKGGEWHASMPNIQERIHYFPRLLDSAFTYEPLYVPSLPEPRSKFLQRCQHTVKALNQRHAFKPKSALVVVTHAAACIGLCMAATLQPASYIEPAAPCSIYHLHRWGGGGGGGSTNESDDKGAVVWQLDPHDAIHSKNGYTQHLSTLGNHTVPWNHFGFNQSLHQGYSGPPTSRFAPQSLKDELRLTAGSELEAQDQNNVAACDIKQ